ncbi:hypothetical protein [Kitasatospora cathayae]|uniref:Uncharacterized protein n=1 Tax=Kitasatospora cathayae TaxID=3004092 RepID=A0ABY7Q8X4_9ACTN|nr:hypothetical protein [Kitasatospora sp. HUAS 3-15]WBP89190.1 hypothetical protein O1G21_27325 [Kitasatospora sp. HUAS 3-15]
MWSILGDIASASPWLVLFLLLILAAALVASMALCLRGTQAGERPAIIRALAELVRALRGGARR